MRELNSYGVMIVRGDPIESFLLMRHPTRYDVPKGHIDPGETKIECALRELEEETGITSDDIGLDTDFCFSSTYEVQPKKFNFETCQKTTTVFLGRLLAMSKSKSPNTKVTSGASGSLRIRFSGRQLTRSWQSWRST